MSKSTPRIAPKPVGEALSASGNPGIIQFAANNLNSAQKPASNEDVNAFIKAGGTQRKHAKRAYKKSDSELAKFLTTLYRNDLKMIGDIINLFPSRGSRKTTDASKDDYIRLIVSECVIRDIKRIKKDPKYAQKIFNKIMKMR